MQAPPLRGGAACPKFVPMSKPKHDEPTPLPPNVQTPAPIKEPPAQKPDPTRFGDWEVNGRCIDF